MAEKEDFEGDHLTSGTTSFSQLLFGDDDDDNDNDNGVAVGLGVDQTLGFSSVFPIDKTPRMLCFGDYDNEGEQLLLSETNGTPPKSVITSSDSSSPSSCNRSFNSLSKSNNKKRNGSGEELIQCMKRVVMAAGTQKPPKRIKADNPTSTDHPKRKEKLGERIAALQQLVSPFGKTDTASVLHEAMGYIRFLQDQVQVLCSPFLQPHQHHDHHHLGDGHAKAGGGEEGEKNLRSRGLCLIPVECTVHVANSNGADFWSPVMGNHGNRNISSSSIRQQP